MSTKVFSENQIKVKVPLDHRRREFRSVSISPYGPTARVLRLSDIMPPSTSLLQFLPKSTLVLTVSRFLPPFLDGSMTKEVVTSSLVTLVYRSCPLTSSSDRILMSKDQIKLNNLYQTLSLLHFGGSTRSI